ncbi:MAG TPA: hydantoinase/oxoprolinase family protein [Hyphomicrobiaceae bacterium]|nr:hydantoinase/oxoprolinase family protein [Hyphomicrobiaceae bacterium]
MGKRYGLGIDVGGTFTDIVIYDAATGRQASRKELTTHGDPSRGVMTGIDRLLRESDIASRDIGRLVHATTLFSNAVIERKGAPTGLITTQGFRDTLEIGRERKYELYDIRILKPAPLVPRRLRLEVPERIGVDGRVRVPLDEAALLQAAARLEAEGVASVAIVFLHSYANHAHERRAAGLLAAHHPNLTVSTSVDVAPEIREYERVSTTVINAYVKPLAERYISSLAAQAAERGIAAPLLLMLSNGGLTNIEEAKRTPVQLLESGPAAGALVAAHLGAADGGRHVLAFDMGGTTAKLSVVEDGKPTVAYSFEAAREKRFVEGSGLPVRISALELIEIGAGGGSIAHLDDIGLLKVGPTSAGSEPGPAAYGRGGREPTVTDADFMLGYLNPAYFVGGTMAIDVKAAEAALGPLAAQAGLGATDLAWGIHDVVNENMASAARVHIAEHGKDPRRYALLCTGGAGPVHAYYVAKKLGLKRLIAPRGAGVASALGLLIAPARVDRVATVAREMAHIAWPELEATFARLEADAREVLAATLPDGRAAAIARLADIRYVGQASELVVPLPDGPYTAASRGALLKAFEQSYIAAFTRTPPTTQVEIINVRVSASIEIDRGAQAGPPPASAVADPVKGTRPVYFPEFREFRPTRVYDRYALGAGQAFDGPAIVEERESTLVVGPGGRFEVAASGNIIVTIG